MKTSADEHWNTPIQNGTKYSLTYFQSKYI